MSITPKYVDYFVEWQIAEAFTTALELISKANGYNTSPFVTRDQRKVWTRDEKFILVVETGSSNMVDSRNTEIEVSVSGWIKVRDDEDPIRERCRLLQDARTAVMADLATLADSIGTGCAVRMGRTDTDQGLLLDDGWAAFDQQFLIRYPQGSTW